MSDEIRLAVERRAILGGEHGDPMTTLPEDYAAVCTVPHRDTILRLILAAYARRHGPDMPLDLDRLNSLLATHNQPLANEAEIAVLYGQAPPVRDLMYVAPAPPSWSSISRREAMNSPDASSTP